MVPKSEEMQRQAQINKEQAQDHSYLEENHEGRIGGFVLYQIHEISFEDSASIKGFILVWGLNGKQQRLAAATGGHGWQRRSLGALGRVQGKRRRKKWLFSAAARNLKPTTLKFSASVKKYYLTLHMLYCKSQWSKCGQLSYEPPEKILR